MLGAVTVSEGSVMGKSDHRSGRRPGGRSARIKSAVLDVAFKLLIKRGFQNLTIADVATASGVHETTIYRRWKSVAGLALDACLHGVSDVIPAPNTGSLRFDLITLLRDIRDVLESPTGRALLEICRISDDDVVRARRAFWAARFNAAKSIFERAAERGELRSDPDSKLVLELLIAPLYLRALVTVEPLNECPIEAIVDAVLGAAMINPKPRARRVR